MATTESVGVEIDKVKEKLKGFALVVEIVSGRLKDLEGVSKGGQFFSGFFKSINDGYSNQLSSILNLQDQDETRRRKENGEIGQETSTDDQAADTINGAMASVTQNKKKLDDDAAKSDSATWGKMVANALTGSKKLRKIHKALAIATTITNTAKGVVSALSGPPDGPPFPLNLAQAAFVAATGAQQLAAIKGQAHDGLDRIPSTGTYLLEQGERVVGSRLNQDLSDFLAVQRGEGSSTTTTNSVTNAPVINLSFGSDVDENTVSQNRGAVETMIREIYADHGMLAPFA